MRAHRFVLLLFAVGLAGGCSCGNHNHNAKQLSTGGITPETHASFPISSGPHAVDCNTCHGGFSSFTQFICFNCHAHDEPQTDAIHDTVAGYRYDSGACYGCHQTGVAQGAFHLAGSANPSTCLPCHEKDRPADTSRWQSPSWAEAPFDYGTNSAGSTHGGGLDCVSCHPGPGSGHWGGSQNWIGGQFAHGAGTLAETTCIDCHSTQRPDLLPGTSAAQMASLLGFDHERNGTGDCFGCHQATVAAGQYAHLTNPATGRLPGGDWKGGSSYPGATPIGSPGASLRLSETTLQRGTNNLITGSSTRRATLYNPMVHTATTIPPELNPGPSATPDASKCWHCHTHDGTAVTSFANGQYHAALSQYAATPGGAASPLPQPTQGCEECHALTRPRGVVQLDATNLHPIDHDAEFLAPVTMNGQTVSRVSEMPCSACHQRPGDSWADGLFHTQIDGGKGKDCSACHFPLMADATAADLADGTRYQMRHRSTQVGVQNCSSCHTQAFNNAKTSPPSAALWKPGSFHASIPTQPTGCVDCHASSAPAAATQSTVSYALAMGATASNQGQWMNHRAGMLAGVDCAVCHLADAQPASAAWSKSTPLHASIAPSTCQECHGLTNGNGATPGEGNNLPSGPVDSATLTTASNDASTGVAAGTHDQIDHADLNVTSHDCSFCHAQAAPSGPQGREWAQARFHERFSAQDPLVSNGTTARCSNCHLNVKPGPSFTAQDHSAFTGAPDSQDCSACHAWPGTDRTTPNWLGVGSGPPAQIVVGGFTVPQPPASGSTTEAGIDGLAHPAVPAGGSCLSCHANAAGGTQAIGYDHASTAIAMRCSACHEAGSNLVGTAWNGATTTSSGAGDTRPFSLTSLRASYRGGSLTVTQPNHFYPVDCGQCHLVPPGTGQLTTGSGYLDPGVGGAWFFPHDTSKMNNPTTCLMCHTNGVP